MQQLVFELAAPRPPTFASFVTGRNAEVVAALGAAARGDGETSLMLWGAPDAGKTHLLAATLDAAREAGRAAAAMSAERVDAGLEPASGLVVLDRVDAADVVAAGRIFTLFNRLRDKGGTLVATSRVPPARLALREDLRTRLGSGLVYEVVPLSDEEKRAALAACAEARGFALAADVLDYLLRHGRRDMSSLVATVEALDRASLAAKRPVSIALAREWLQREIEWTPRSIP